MAQEKFNGNPYTGTFFGIVFKSILMLIKFESREIMQITEQKQLFDKILPNSSEV